MSTITPKTGSVDRFLSGGAGARYPAAMTLSQTQIIRSLADALQWFEKELAWGAPVAELRHLTGRIGELYAAMITRGQMALSVNQVGYDVVSAEGERITVKTFTSSTRINFNPATLHNASRVMILQIVIDEGEPSIREVLDCPVDELQPMLRTLEGSTYLPVNRILASTRVARSVADLKEVARAAWRGYEVAQLENGTILVREDGALLPMAKPALRIIAREIGVDPMGATGNPKNTRRLGADIIAALG